MGKNRLITALSYFAVGMLMAAGPVLLLGCDDELEAGQYWMQSHRWTLLIGSQVRVDITSINADGSANYKLTVKERTGSSLGNASAFHDKNGNGRKDRDEPLATPGSPVTGTIPAGTSSAQLVIVDCQDKKHIKTLTASDF